MTAETYRRRDRGENYPDLVRQYLMDIGREPLLSAEDEVELAKTIEAGQYARHILETDVRQLAEEGIVLTDMQRENYDLLEEAAREGEAAKLKFVRANLRLVVSVARKYHRGGEPNMQFLDIVQEGNLGLIRAVEKFDYQKGFKFSTYAMWWIRQAIERGRADKSRTMRVPIHMIEVLNKLDNVGRKLELELGREPDDDELAAELDVTPERFAELKGYIRNLRLLSLDAELGDGQAGPGEKTARLGDLIEDVDAVNPAARVEQVDLADRLGALVDSLPEREAAIIRLRFGLGDAREHTLQEVADEIGLTKERIRQLEKLALGKLRDKSGPEISLYWNNE